MEHFNFKGKYTWIREPADCKKVNNRKWDLIWDTGCFTMGEIDLIPKNQTLFYYHYDHPRPLYNELKEIDKITPIQGLGKTISFHGNIQKHIKKIIGFNPYRSAINLQSVELNHMAEVFWPFNKKRIIPHVATYRNGDKNNWKYQYPWAKS